MAKENCYKFGTLIVETVFEYDTPKYVHIKNKKIGVIYRLVQLAILAYVIGYGIVYQHQAQKFETVQSVVTTKLKGVDAVDNPESFMTNCPTRPPDENWVVFDHTDLVVPPQQPSAFFVTTNMWVTCNQTYGECPEDKTVSGASCNSDADCPVGVVLRAGNGVTTGNCSNFGNTSEEGTCMIRAWCPVEDENDTLTAQGPKVDIRNFTVLVKNTVSFPTLEKTFRSRNIDPNADKAFLNTCVHNETTGLYCPIFSLGQIIDMANSTPEFYHEVTTYGAVIGLQVHWDCNLDFGRCSLEYEASRLDNPEVRISPGYNFRYSRYYYLSEGSQQYRDEIKAYGILFMVEVTGQGRKFDVVTLVLALGSTIALLAIATVVTDGFAMYIVKRASYYRTKKYQQVDKEQSSPDDSEPQKTIDPKINYGSTATEGPVNEKQPLLMEVQPAAGSPP